MRLRNEYLGIYLEPETQDDKQLIRMATRFLLDFHVGQDIDKIPDGGFFGCEGQNEEIQTILARYGIQKVTPEQAVGLFKQGRRYLEAELKRFYEAPRKRLQAPSLD